ncbi:MAG: tripartite tricarboxylate transporter permease, partial [Advenella sp.]
VVVVGVIGYWLRKMEIPMAPLVLGVVLGDMMEQNLRRALSITNGDATILVQSNISIGLWIASAAVVLLPLLLRKFSRKGKKLLAQAADDGE